MSPRVIIDFQERDYDKIEYFVQHIKEILDADCRLGKSSIIKSSGIEIQILKRRAILCGYELQLTPHEFDLLCLLVSNPGQVFTKYQIYDAVWNEASESVDNIVICTIYGIRRKIRNITNRQFIHTVRGVGYKFEE